MTPTPAWGPILCPVDFSEISASALRLATLIGGRCSRPVTALHAQWFDVPPYLTASRSEQIREQLRDSLEDARLALRRFVAETVQDGAVAIRVEEGDPREAILRVAGSAGFALIVMGTRGREGVARLTLGSVAERVMHTSRIPVLTVRSTHPVGSISRIVCAVNDSEVSRNALAQAAELARCLAARLIVVHVLQEGSARAIPDLCEWIGRRERPDCEIQEITKHGHPPGEIVRLIGELDAELLVIGAEHRLFLDKSVIGDTTSHLVRHAPCAVLTVMGGTE